MRISIAPTKAGNRHSGGKDNSNSWASSGVPFHPSPVVMGYVSSGPASIIAIPFQRLKYGAINGPTIFETDSVP